MTFYSFWNTPASKNSPTHYSLGITIKSDYLVKQLQTFSVFLLFALINSLKKVEPNIKTPPIT